MKNPEATHPFSVLLFFLAVVLPAMFSLQPVLSLLSLIGGSSFLLVRREKGGGKFLLFLGGLFLLFTLLNPLFSHAGQTVLFVLNDRPIMLESLLYGAVSALSVLSALLWFRAFAYLMTGDRLLYLFGSLSPRVALVLSMALRDLPLFGRQHRKTVRAQRALGLYRDDAFSDRLRGSLRVFSALTGWALENGIVTADSMTARGYGCGKRTFFSRYRFRAWDYLLLALTAGLLLPVLLALFHGSLTYSFYPAFIPAGNTLSSFCAYLAYAVLSLLPVTAELWENHRWKS